MTQGIYPTLASYLIDLWGDDLSLQNFKNNRAVFIFISLEQPYVKP